MPWNMNLSPAPLSVQPPRLLHVHPVSLRGALSSPVLREGAETTESFSFCYKYTSNDRGELPGLWQGFPWPQQTTHCYGAVFPSNRLTASLSGGATKPAIEGDVAGGRMCPGHLGSVPCTCFTVVVAQTAWVRPPAWPVHGGSKGKILFKIYTSVVALKERWWCPWHWQRHPAESPWVCVFFINDEYM